MVLNYLSSSSVAYCLYVLLQTFHVLDTFQENEDDRKSHTTSFQVIIVCLVFDIATHDTQLSEILPVTDSGEWGGGNILYTPRSQILYSQGNSG